MHNHCINKLINLEDVIVKKVIHADSFVKIHLETKPKEHICPNCGTLTKRIHDYRMQTIKDLPFQLKHCFLILKKHRYICSCGKRFYENYSFLPRYFQRTSRLTASWIPYLFNGLLFLKHCLLMSSKETPTVKNINVSL